MPHWYYCEQRSDEWFKLRLGVATASDFDKLITPGGKPSKSETTHRYMCRLIGQRLLGRDEDALVSPTYAMERGKMLEQSAIDYYQLVQGVKTKSVGFVLSDCGIYGASPDQEVGEDGIMEIKCPMAGGHVNNMLTQEVDRDYWPQVQGQLLVTDRDWSDWMSYHPELRPSIIRVQRDAPYLFSLKMALDAFGEAYVRSMNHLVKLGLTDKDTLTALPNAKQTINDELEEFVP